MAITMIPILIFVLCLSAFNTVHCRKGFGDEEQEWGYATVRPGAHMFWWLYYTTNQEVSSFYEKPLIIWLQGGPGGSSTGLGNFEEIGPLDPRLQHRNSTWVKQYNILFVDNPVGTGFSYVDYASAYATTNAQIASDLLKMMRNFYNKLPGFRKVPVYIVSESYGGKMAAEFALEWDKAEKSGSIESNLKGVALGDSWISPIDSVLSWGPYLLQLGFVDTNGYNKIQKAALQTKKAVDAGSWAYATELWGYTEEVILSVTKNVDFYNVMSKVRSSGLNLRSGSRSRFPPRPKRSLESDDALVEKLMNGGVKEALNLPVYWDAVSDEVFTRLSTDFMKPVIDIVERLLDETNVKVFVYTGQLDLIVDTPGTLIWAEKLNWSHSKQWHSSQRTALTVNGVVEGYRKVYKNFGFYWVNRAGHMVPQDNPGAALAIMEELTAN